MLATVLSRAGLAPCGNVLFEYRNAGRQHKSFKSDLFTLQAATLTQTAEAGPNEIDAVSAVNDDHDCIQVGKLASLNRS